MRVQDSLPVLAPEMLDNALGMHEVEFVFKAVIESILAYDLAFKGELIQGLLHYVQGLLGIVQESDFRAGPCHEDGVYPSAAAYLQDTLAPEVIIPEKAPVEEPPVGLSLETHVLHAFPYVRPGHGYFYAQNNK